MLSPLSSFGFIKSVVSDDPMLNVGHVAFDFDHDHGHDHDHMH